MSQVDEVDAEIITRRTATLVAALVAAMPSTVGNAEETDPIFRLVKRYWKLDRAFERFLHNKGIAEVAAGSHELPEWEAVEQRFNAAWMDAEWQVLTTPPTTIAGVCAVLAFVRAQSAPRRAGIG